MVVFLEPMYIEIVIHTKTGSVQLMFGTVTCPGDRKKLARVISPAMTASAGSHKALPICLQPYYKEYFTAMYT